MPNQNFDWLKKQNEERNREARMNKIKDYNKPPQTAFNKLAYNLNKKITKPFLNKTLRAFTGNKEVGKKYPLYKSNMLILKEDVVLPKGAISMTIWESKDDYHGNPWKDGVARVDVSIAPLSDMDKESLKKSGYIFDEENLEWINKKFVSEKMEVNVSRTQTDEGGASLDTGLNDRVDDYADHPQSTSQTNYDMENMDDDIPF